MADQGHATNVAHFEELVSICAGLGAQYDPSNADIALAAIQAQHAAVEASFANWGDKRAAEDFADTSRENAFDVLGPTATATVNYYGSTDAPENRIEDAKGFLRKLRGRRAAKLEDDPNTPEDESQGGISVAQTSYVQKVAHLDGLIDLYGSDAMYSPNEADIQLAALVTLSDTLKAFNTASFDANTETAAARSAFFVNAYTGDNNMLDTAMQIKKYLKALLGPSNIIYKQAAGLSFSRPRP